MKQIDKYINSIYKDVAGDRREIEELKQEMRSHLIEAVEELKAEGNTEEEAIRTAIENFGGKSQIVKGLSEFFKVQKEFANYVLSFALIFLVLGVFFLTSSISEVKQFIEEVEQLDVVEQEKEVIMNEALDILVDSTDITEQETGKLFDVFNKYQEKLNLLAVFSATELEDWLQENQVVKEGPDTHYPIEYSKAAIVIGNNEVIENKEQIVASEYDLGTVIMANEKWIVQYEYNVSYEKTVEKHHQLKHYGPSILNFYQLPILFFSLFSILGFVWLFLRKHNRQLKGVIS